jgi:hypothetical protein
MAGMTSLEVEELLWRRGLQEAGVTKDGVLGIDDWHEEVWSSLHTIADGAGLC